MNVRFPISRVLVTLTLTVCFPLVTGAEIVVDNYTAGSTIAQFGPGTFNQTTVSGSILGGSRDDSLTVRNLGGNEFFGNSGWGPLF